MANTYYHWLIRGNVNHEGVVDRLKWASWIFTKKYAD